MRALAIFAITGCLLGGATRCATAGSPQQRGVSSVSAASQRTRLVMRDGSYQMVLSYTVKGAVVHYLSAERDGAEEEVPLALVDLPATRAWAAQHAAGDDPQRAVLSPDLARAEAERAARTPEISPGLRLPGEDSAVVLDSYSGRLELVPMEQQGGDLNKETAHDVRPQPINPAAAPHDILDLTGSMADVQVHTPQPRFYLRIGEDDIGDPGGSAITVDTQGRAGRADSTGGSTASDYVLVRLLLRNDMRQLDSFRISELGRKQRSASAAMGSVVELAAEALTGGKWLKLTPAQPLEEGEYALVEVLSAGSVNLLVWDFGVHAQARENAEAIRPQAAKAPALERR